MNADLKANNDALARKLGLRKERPWDLGLPDLTSAEGHLLLEKTLLERGIELRYLAGKDIEGLRAAVVLNTDTFATAKYADDPDLRIALVLAAHKLLVTQ